MFNSLKSIINNGGYQLDSLKNRLENLAAYGDITPEQKEELLNAARVKADPAQEIDARKLLLEHERRIRALEALLAQGGEGGGTGEVTLHKEYVVGTPTTNGDKWSWKGVNYTIGNVPEGSVCVWSPEGYPAYWIKDAVQPETAGAEA